MSNCNLAARLEAQAARHASRAAIVEYHQGRSRRITFGELTRRVSALSQGIQRAGIREGDHVLLFVPMSIDLYVALLAVFHAGATAVFVDAWADEERLSAAITLAEPRLFVGTPKAQLLRLASPSIRRIPRHWIAGRRFLRLSRYEKREGSGSPRPVSPEQPALITFTTGSTGAPKAAARSHGFLWAQHLALASHLGLLESDVDMPTLPVFVLNNLALGITSVLPDFDPRRPGDIVPEKIVQQMQQEGVTTTSGSPAFYEALLAWTSSRGMQLPLRGLWTGGAPVLPPLAARLAEGIEGRAHVVYGSTEAEPIAGIEAREMLRRMESPSVNSGSGLCCGIPVPQLAVRIIRPQAGPIVLGAQGGWQEWELPRGETGEIVVAGSHVLGEYYQAPRETALHKIREGETLWHRTGDAGYLDAEGYLWLMGRVSSRVVREGETHWPLPAELRALNIPGVTHAAYLGEPDPLLGQKATLCLEGSPALRELGKEVARSLHPLPVDEMILLHRIPRDPRHASKTNTVELRRLLAKIP